MTFCITLNDLEQPDPHQWTETDRIKIIPGLLVTTGQTNLEDIKYFSLQMCKVCGECRKVEYKEEE